MTGCSTAALFAACRTRPGRASRTCGGSSRGTSSPRSAGAGAPAPSPSPAAARERVYQVGTPWLATLHSSNTCFLLQTYSLHSENTPLSSAGALLPREIPAGLGDADGGAPLPEGARTLVFGYFRV